MLSEIQTQLIVEKFFSECFRFWTMKGKGEREAFTLALKDVSLIKHDPYVPNGDDLNLKVKEKFIYYRKMDLGKEN